MHATQAAEQGGARTEAAPAEGARSRSGHHAGRAAVHRIAGGPHAPRIRYEELFADGVLDVTVALGFREDADDTDEVAPYVEAFAALGFVDDAAAARRVLAKAGRSVGEGALGRFLVKEHALDYAGRSVDAVVRLVSHGDGNGRQVAAAFRDGLLRSDAAFYGGHGRYGSGPDFDRNVRFELEDRLGRWERIDAYEDLERRLREEGEPWLTFLHRVHRGSLRVVYSNDGNLVLNARPLHQGEFGGRLMYWLLAQTHEHAQTGPGGALAQPDDAKYRLWVFDGCRTRDYAPAIRKTPGHDAAHTQLVETTRTVAWDTAAPTAAAFVRSLLERSSPRSLVRSLDASMPLEEDHRAFAGEGFGSEEPIR